MYEINGKNKIKHLIGGRRHIYSDLSNGTYIHGARAYNCA